MALAIQRLFFILCVALAASQDTPVHVYEFGTDAPENIILKEYSGEIPTFKPLKIISTRLQPCNVVEYVRVQVENPLAKPNVTYIPRLNKVSINYDLEENTESRYYIVTKGYTSIPCLERHARIQNDAWMMGMYPKDDQ